MKRALLIAVALALALSASAVWAQGGPGGRQGPGAFGGRQAPGGRGQRCPAMAVMPPPAAVLNDLSGALQLTDDQKTKLKDIMTQSDATMAPLLKKFADALQTLRTALTAASFDPRNVKSLAAAAEKAEADIVNARIDVWTKIRGVLTADQITKLQTIMAQPRGTGAGMGPGGRPAPPPGSDNAPAPPPPGDDNPAPPPATD